MVEPLQTYKILLDARVNFALRSIAEEAQFANPDFDIYWPGDYTHPKNHAHISAPHVYVTDRSRASSHDFIILLCGPPSYGVGQENEIATQAGVPAIRLVPLEGLSRMMLGSFIRTMDITYHGGLQSRITFGIENTLGVDAGVALWLRDHWRSDFAADKRKLQSSASFRRPTRLMREVDWDKQYRQELHKDTFNAKLRDPSLSLYLS